MGNKVLPSSAAVLFFFLTALPSPHNTFLGDLSSGRPPETLSEPLQPLAFLLGEWKASGTGQPGEAGGQAVFAPCLQGRVIVRKSFAEYPASGGKPASRHDDLIIIYEAQEGGVRAEYFDNEGHVIRYDVGSPRNGEAVFLSRAGAEGPRYRLTYLLSEDGVLKGEFAIAPPGKPDAFTSYLTWESRKADGR